MLKKMMARFGKGAAKVDLVLEQSSVPLGSVIKGTLYIQGGEVEQEIRKIEIELYFKVKMNDQTLTHLAAVIPYQASFIIQPHERKKVPFELPLPDDLLISSNTVSYYLKTKMDIAGGLDASDQDEVRITPPEDLAMVINAFHQLGFQEQSNSRFFNGISQEFLFQPTTLFRDKIDALSFIVALEPQAIRILAKTEVKTFLGKKPREKEITFYHHMFTHPDTIRHHLHMALNEMILDKSSKGIKQSSFVGALGKWISDLIFRER